jgi:hypothetical protein
MTAAQFLERIRTIIGLTDLDRRHQRELTELFDQIRDDFAHDLSDWIEAQKTDPETLGLPNHSQRPKRSDCL